MATRDPLFIDEKQIPRLGEDMQVSAIARGAYGQLSGTGMLAPLRNVNVAACTSLEFAPTNTWNVPGSATRLIDRS